MLLTNYWVIIKTIKEKKTTKQNDFQSQLNIITETSIKIKTEKFNKDRWYVLKISKYFTLIKLIFALLFQVIFEFYNNEHLLQNIDKSQQRYNFEYWNSFIT